MRSDDSAARGAAHLDRAAKQDLPAVVNLVRADTLTPEPVKWIWPGYLAGGKLHVLAGQPGTGKTTLALAIAATISTGGLWPDGARAAAGDILVWSGEDDPADTIVPRLMAAGADRSRIHIVSSVTDGDGARAFDPATDIDALLTAAHAVGDVKLLIVDPVISAVQGDSHKNAETRRALQPLVDFGRDTGAAVLGISHFSKGTAGRDPLERLSGSLAFGALARLVFGAAVKKTDDGEDERVFLRIKSNIGPDGGGFAYRLDYEDLGGGIQGSRVVWGEAIQGHARDVLADYDAQPDTEGKSTVDEASDWLRDLLNGADGEMDRGEVLRKGRDNGFSERTIQRAREKAGVEAVVRGFGKSKTSRWKLSIHANRAMRANETTSQNVGTVGMNGMNGTDGTVPDCGRGLAEEDSSPWKGRGAAGNATIDPDVTDVEAF